MDQHAKIDWRAHWIWQPTDKPDQDNTYVYFRRTLELPTVPREAITRVSADTHYRLFINGNLVGWGPVLTEPRWQTFDTYDAAQWLKEGKNVIAAITYHYGNGPDNETRNTYHPSRGGFLCQVELTAEGESFITDDSWRCLESQAWARDVPMVDRMTYAEFYDARQAPEGWLNVDFDDSEWARAEVVTLGPRAATWNWNPSASAVLPWMKLEPRPIPQFVLEPIQPKAIIYCSEVLQRAQPLWSHDLAVRMSLETPNPSKYTRIENVERLLEGDRQTEPAVVHPMSDNFSYDDYPGIHDACIALDVGKLINGRVKLDLTAPAGTVIHLGYSQILVEGRVIPYLSYRTPMADQFITREGRQTLETYNWRNFQYILLTFRLHQTPIQIHQLDIDFEHYPFEEVGSFECNDETLNWIWNACVHTTRLCVYDRIMDNPVRERREYMGDILCMLDAIYAAFGQAKIVDKYFRDIKRSQYDYGLFPHTILGNPLEINSIYVESQYELVYRAWQHFQLFGDKKILEDFYEPFKGLMDYLQNFIDERGLMGPAPFTMFVDWADIQRTGQTLIVNLLQAEGWRVMAYMARELGHEIDKTKFEQKHNNLKMRLNALYWDAERGVYHDSIVDGKPGNHFSEHVNFLMMFFDLASDPQCQAMTDMLKDPGIDIGQVEPSFIWAAEGLFRRGHAQWALDLLRRRYARIRRQGLNTIPELWHLLGERYTGRWLECGLPAEPVRLRGSPGQTWFFGDLDRATAL